MKAAIKFIMTATGLLLIGIAVGIILLSTQLEGLATGQVERRMGNMLGTDVSVEKIRWAPLELGIALDQVTVFNPPAFKPEPAIYCESILIRFRPETVFSETPTIAKVSVEGMDLTLRYGSEGANLLTLAGNARDFAEAEAARENRRRKPVIETVACAESKLRIAPGPPIPLTIAAFEVKKEEGVAGIPAAKGVSVLLRSVFEEALTLRGLAGDVRSLFQRGGGEGA